MSLPVARENPSVFEIKLLPLKSNKVQKLMKVIKITDVESSCRNVLWLSKHDTKRLFPKDNVKSSERYVTISRMVYRVAINKMLKKGMAGVNRLQYEEIASSITKLDTNECVVVSPIVIENRAIEASYVLFDIERYNATKGVNFKEPSVLNLEDISLRLRAKFKKHAVKEGQSYLIEIDHEQYKLCVNCILQVDEKKKVCTFGKDTEIDLIAGVDSQISITQEVVNTPIRSFKFELSLLNILDKENPFPPVISIDSLKSKLKEALEGKVLVHEKEWVLPLDNGVKLKVCFKEAEERRKKVIIDCKRFESSKLYDKVYAFDSKAEILFDWDVSELTLSLFSQLQPKSITFEVLTYAKTKRDDELKHFRKEWLSIEEVKNAIYKMNTSFVQNQEFFLELKSGVYKVKVGKIEAPSKVLDDKRERIKTKWRVKKNVPVIIDEGYRLNPILVHTSQEYPIRRLVLRVSPSKKSLFVKAKEGIISENEILNALKEEFKKKIVEEQIFHIPIGKDIYTVSVEEFDIDCKEEYSDKYQILGRIREDTVIEFVKDPEDALTVLPESKLLDIKDPIAKLEELGVGGLSKQMKDIVREIFLGRGKLRKQMIRRGRKPEKGILFYGPPGTGKTALARNLAEMLKGENVRMITAPELFNKYVGESEGNVRKLFEPAEAAYKQLGDKSPLFVIIIDEIDGLLTVRGDDGNTVRNSVVNQFLAKIDGPHQLNNILVIGMTNRKDKIDPAALRSGRLGLHIEIPAPDQKGREKIFEIHTRSLKKEKLLGEKIDFKELSEMMENCVGADVEAVVKRATSYAMERLNLLDLSDEELDAHPDGITTMKDFLLAVKELKKQKGKEEKMSQGAKRMFL